MSFSIMLDPHRSMAALVMDDPLFALGPVVVSDEPEEAQELLQTFVDNLEADPSRMPTLELMNEWQSFLIAFHGYLQRPADAPPVEPQEAAGGDPGTPDGETPAPDVADPQNGGPASEPAPPVTPSSSEAPAGSASQTIGDSSTQTPTLNDGEQVCFACNGEGSFEIGGEQYDCRTCGGSGKLPAAASV